MQETQSNGSMIARRAGLCCLAGLSALAVYFHANLIGAFLLILTLLGLFARLWSRMVTKHISLQAEALPQGCFAGESVTLKITLKNNGILPLVWLDVILPMGKKPLLKDEKADSNAKYLIHGSEFPQSGILRRFVWLAHGQQVIWQENFPVQGRGVVLLEGAEIQAGDGLGLSASGKFYKLPQPMTLMFYPRKLQTIGSFLELQMYGQSRNRRGSTEDTTLLRSSRSYQPGDSLRNINWRMVAATGQMMTNVYETVTPGCKLLVLDLESFAETIEESASDGRTVKIRKVRTDELETVLSVMATTVALLQEKRLGVQMVLPGIGEKQAVIVGGSDGEQAYYACLEQLAALAFEEEQVQPLPVETLSALQQEGEILLFCRSLAALSDPRLFILCESRARILTLDPQDEARGDSGVSYAGKWFRLSQKEEPAK